MQSSLVRLNLGPRLAKNKSKWKKDKQRKSQQTGRWKAIQLVLKEIEWPDQLSTKRKGNCNQPTSEERSLYLTFSEIQISPIEETEGVNSLFLMFYGLTNNSSMLLSKWKYWLFKILYFFLVCYTAVSS